jgi:hypothetical protein
MTRAELIECGIARWYPDTDTIVARTGASLAEIRSVLGRMNAAEFELDRRVLSLEAERCRPSRLS